MKTLEVPISKVIVMFGLGRPCRRLLYIHAHLAQGEEGERESGPPARARARRRRPPAGPVATLGG